MRSFGFKVFSLCRKYQERSKDLLGQRVMTSNADSRLFSLVLLATLAAGISSAQPSSQVRVYSVPPDGTFLVDGIQYRGSQTFVWPTGSKHFLEADLENQTGGVDTRWTFSAWKDNRGLIGNGANRFQTVTANPAITSYEVLYNKEFRIQFIFYSAPGIASGAPCSTSSAFPGQVFVNNQCYQTSFSAYYAVGQELSMQAVPNTGFIFTGWLVNGNPPSDSSLRTYTVRSPALVTPIFAPAKRVLFYTDPESLQVSVDRTPFNTAGRFEDVGRSNPGLREFAGGARHLLSAPSPQQDLQGRVWVFDSYDVSLGPGGVYEVTNVNMMQTVTARFVRGATVSFLTQPSGLKLSVNGRDTWPSLNFVWAVGSANTVTAPAITTDRRGRKYRFLNWSNGGPATQDITTPADTTQGGLRLTANYELLPRVTITTNQPASRILIDGLACEMPCALDRPNGSTVALEATATIAFGADSRAEFASWNDSGERIRTLAFAGDERRVSLSYRMANTLRAVADPVEGATFTFEPPSADGFYPETAAVRVTVNSLEGFRFRRWAGDLDGSSDSGVVSLRSPRLVRALLDRIPVIPSAGIRNAAGETPDLVVAPGSVISVFGRQLAPDYAAGPTGPLSQVLAGTTVRWGNRLLPLLFVSPEQINAQLPFDLAEGEQVLAVRTGNQPEIQGKVQIVRNAPGLFGFTLDSKFYLAATHEDGSVISPDSPARRGETITLLGTGFGPYVRPVFDGFPVPLTPANPVADPVELRVGENLLTPLSAIASPGQVGLVAVKLFIGEQVATGREVVITAVVNGRSSNTAILPIE